LPLTCRSLSKRQIIISAILIVFILIAGSWPSKAYYIRLAFGDPLVYLPYEAVWVGLTLFVPIDLVEVFDGVELEILPDNSHLLTYNGKSKTFTAKSTDSVVEGDTFFVSLTSLVTFLGLKMNWDAETATVYLTPTKPLIGVREIALSDIFNQSLTGLEEQAQVQAALSEQEVEELEAFLSIGQEYEDQDLLQEDQGLIDIIENGTEPEDLSVLQEYTIKAEKAHRVEAVWSQTEDGRERITIQASKDFIISTFLLTDPNRLVVDLNGLYSGHTESVTIDSDLVKLFRLQQNQEDVVRLVAELKEMVGYQVIPLGENVYQITLNYAMREMKADFNESGGTLSLDLPALAAFSHMRLSDPERIVIDINNTTLIPGETILPGGGPVHHVRISQHDPFTTRIVMEVDDDYQLLPVRKQDKLVFLGAQLLESIGYAQLPSGNLFIHLLGTNLPEPQVLYFSRSKGPVLVLDLPAVALSHQLANVEIPSGLGWSIRSAQHADKVRIVVDLRLAVDYTIYLLENNGLGVVLTLPDLTGRKIFVDPGHGGSIAPGAKGKKLEEKEINLATALYLKQLLKRSGAEVIFSREDDTYVSLADRLNISQNSGADIFLSIHANSATNTKATGIETWMHDRFRVSGSVTLAATMQKALVDMLGLIDRGIKQKSLAVLASADIPRVLLEIGFLSNEEEEEMLSQDWFRRLSAQGIFNGIVAYYNLTEKRIPSIDTAKIYTEVLSVLRNNELVYLPEKDKENSSLEVSNEYLVLNEEFFQE
jgi:N-acetylmuramoyl-L-alanine amidase